MSWRPVEIGGWEHVLQIWNPNPSEVNDKGQSKKNQGKIEKGKWIY